MKTKVIIIEDEQHLALMLKDMILEIRPQWSISAMLQSVHDAVEWLSNNMHPQVIFLDIELADGNCFSIFNQVKVQSDIIFTTAYNEFALKAFELNSIDYLLKPIKATSLKKAIDKFDSAKERYLKNDGPSINYQELASSILSSQKSYRQRFIISKRESFLKLAVDEIAYIYFDNRITFAVTFDGQQHIINQTLDKTEQDLDPIQFFRANRQTLLNVDAIERFEVYFSGKLMVKLIKGLNDKIMVSRAKASLFKEWINQ